MVEERERDVEYLKREEAVFFDRIALSRSEEGKIPETADIRRATRAIPKSPDEEPVDPRMTSILEGDFRSRWIDWAAHTSGGRVLDVCCGPGWLALELGRRGQTVDAYDISPKAIAVAKRMLHENPYNDEFGQVNYHLQDVTTVDLGCEKYDAICGWSAFHHLPNLREFMDKAYRALKPGGIAATLDDLPKGRLEQGIERCLRLILPIYHQPYRQKLRRGVRVLLGRDTLMQEVFSPMEYAKHTVAPDETAAVWYEKFEILEDSHFNAFTIPPLLALAGPDGFRYAIGRLLVSVDRLLCGANIVHGRLRVIIGRKRVH